MTETHTHKLYRQIDTYTLYIHISHRRQTRMYTTDIYIHIHSIDRQMDHTPYTDTHIYTYTT